MGPGELNAETVAVFFGERRWLGHRWLITAKAARPLLVFLGEAEVLPAPSRPAPVGPGLCLLVGELPAPAVVAGTDGSAARQLRLTDRPRPA